MAIVFGLALQKSIRYLAGKSESFFPFHESMRIFGVLLEFDIGPEYHIAGLKVSAQSPRVSTE